MSFLYSTLYKIKKKHEHCSSLFKVLLIQNYCLSYDNEFLGYLEFTALYNVLIMLSECSF